MEIIFLIAGTLIIVIFWFGSSFGDWDPPQQPPIPQTHEPEDSQTKKTRTKPVYKDYIRNPDSPLKLYVFDQEASFDVEVKGVLEIPSENVKHVQFLLHLYDITDSKTIIESLNVDSIETEETSKLTTSQNYLFTKPFKVSPERILKFTRPRSLVSLFKGDLGYIRQGKMKLLFELSIIGLTKGGIPNEELYNEVLTTQVTTAIQFKDYPKLKKLKIVVNKNIIESKPQPTFCISCGTPLRLYASYCNKCGRHVDDLGEIKMNHSNTREASMFLEGYGVIFQYRFVTAKVADTILKYVKREEFTDVFDGIELVQGGQDSIQRITSRSIKGEVSDDNWLHSFEGVLTLTLKAGEEEVELEPSIPYLDHDGYPVGKIMLDACKNSEEFPYVIVYRTGGGMDIDQKIEIDASIDSLEDIEDDDIRMDNLHISIFDGPPIYLDNYEFNELVHDAFMILRLEDLDGVTIGNIMNESIYWNEISQ